MKNSNTLLSWKNAHALGMLVFGSATINFGLLPFVCFVFVSFAFLIGLNWTELEKNGLFGGMANQITILRLVLLCFLAVSAPKFQDTTIFIITVVALSLDGLDGYVARKRGLSSEFGGNLDQEIDGAFVLLWGALLFQRFDFGPWVLLPGLVKYAFPFIVAISIKNAPNEPSKFWKKVVAVAIFCGLVSPFLIPFDWAWWLVLFTAMSVILSFGHSFFWLWNESRKLSKS